MQRPICWHCYKLSLNYCPTNIEFLKINSNSFTRGYGRTFLNFNGCLICTCRISKQSTTAKELTKSLKAYGTKEIGLLLTIWSIKLKPKFSKFIKRTIPNKYSTILFRPFSTKFKIHAILKFWSNLFKTFTNIYPSILGEKYSCMLICGNIIVDITSRPKDKNFNSINFLFSKLLNFSNTFLIFKK